MDSGLAVVKRILIAAGVLLIPVHLMLALGVWGAGFLGSEWAWLGVAKLATTWAVIVCAARWAAKRTVKLGLLTALLEVVGLALWWQCEAHGVFLSFGDWLAADVIVMAAVGLSVPVVLVYSAP